MSLIKLQGNASGTGAFTIAAPNGNTDRTLTLPDATGSVVLNEGSGAFKINSSGNVGIGTAAPVNKLDVLGEVTAGGFYRNADVTSVGAAGVLVDLGARSGSTLTPAGAVGAVLDNPSTTGALQFYSRSSNALAERARITSDGYLRMASGSGGIQFNGDTAAANALNDYEEGTWTVSSPEFTINGNRAGNYRIIGDTCFCWFYLINISSVASSIINVTIPFTSSASAGFGSSGSVFANYNTIGPTSIWINSSTNYMQFYNSPAANANYSFLEGANIYSGASFAMYGSFSYRI